MIDIRLRHRIPEAELQQKVGKILLDEDRNILLERDARVWFPDPKTGVYKLLAIYKKDAIPQELLDSTYDVLHELRKYETTNRGLASGTERFKAFAEATNTYSDPRASTIVGAFDKSRSAPICRLTAFSRSELEKFEQLFPLFRQIGALFAQYVPERHAAQMKFVGETHPEWVIPGTPFTTITVNNSYPTGVHTDQGDLDEGFSNLVVMRRGSYHGGILTFPEWRVGVDMSDRDILLMDAHQWHGNTMLYCDRCKLPMTSMHEDCGTERISVVCYYRTRMKECGTAEEEGQKALAHAEKRIALHDPVAREEVVVGG
jgi:hypothetical protein